MRQREESSKVLGLSNWKNGVLVTAVWEEQMWWKFPKYHLHMLSPCLVDIQVEILRRLLEITSLELSGEVGTEDVNVGGG